jgi:hypothetical protein
MVSSISVIIAFGLETEPEFSSTLSLAILNACRQSALYSAARCWYKLANSFPVIAMFCGKGVVLLICVEVVQAPITNNTTIENFFIFLNLVVKL